MEKKNILYQIKSLEKMIFRALISKQEFKEFSCNHPTPTQMQIMDYILKHQTEEIYQKDLENILNLRRATVSGVLQTMEKNNLIERITDPEDARVKKIILNSKAKEMFLEKEKRIQELEKIVIKGIKKEDLNTFSNVLKDMEENIKNHYND